MTRLVAFIRRLLGKKVYQYVVYTRGNRGGEEIVGNIYIERKYKIDSIEDYRELQRFIIENNKDISNLIITNFILLNSLV